MTPYTGMNEQMNELIMIKIGDVFSYPKFFFPLSVVSLLQVVYHQYQLAWKHQILNYVNAKKLKMPWKEVVIRHHYILYYKKRDQLLEVL